ncbi:hypothetical protein Aduo_005140 [Ancylostoma duodenale]
MDNEKIQNLIMGALIAKGVLDSSKEEYLDSGLDEDKYEATVEFARYMMDKIEAASPKVKDIFHYSFNDDKSVNEDELYNRLEQSDREEFQELQNQLQKSQVGRDLNKIPDLSKSKSVLVVKLKNGVYKRKADLDSHSPSKIQLS